MSKTINFIFFLLISAIIIISIHYYLWNKLFKNTGLTGTIRIIGIVIIIGLPIYFIVAMISSQNLSYKFSQPLLWGAYFWLGVMMLLLFSFLFTDVIKIIPYSYFKFSNSNELFDPDRRKFIAKITALGVSSIVMIISGISVINYYKPAFVKKMNISLKELPEIFNGFKIVQISDLHIGQLMTKSTLEKIVNQVNDLKPDIVAITGDLVDGSIKILANEISPLKNLKAKNGVYFVTGNHEYYSGVENWIYEIEKLGINVLSNENFEITKGKAEDKFYIVGVNDHEAKRFGDKYAPDFNKAFSGIEKDKIKILLAHQPVVMKEAAEYNTDLVLAGHTHGGQIWPFNYLVYLQQPYLKGLYKLADTKLYVNQGTGCWGPPMRLGSKNEITEILLRE